MTVVVVFFFPALDLEAGRRRYLEEEEEAFLGLGRHPNSAMPSEQVSFRFVFLAGRRRGDLDLRFALGFLVFDTARFMGRGFGLVASETWTQRVEGPVFTA